MSKRKHEPTTVGINAKRFRQAKGRTQMEVGRRTGWGQQRIAAIETGGVNNLTQNTLATLAKALGCTVAELVEEDGK